MAFETSIFMEPIHVLGAGSIGLLFASSIRISFPSYPIKLLLRPHAYHTRRLQLIDSNERKGSIQVCVRRIAEDQKKNRPRIVSIPAEIIGGRKTTTKIRNLLLSTKAPDVSPAIESIIDRLDIENKSRIIILSNGALAVRETIKEIFQRKEEEKQIPIRENVQLKLASTTHGAYRDIDKDDGNDDDDGMYHLVHAGVGKTFIEDEPLLSELLDYSGLFCTSLSSLEATTNMWNKLACNCVINPLTALLNCKNGHLINLDDTEYQSLIKNVIEEVSKVAIAEMPANEKVVSHNLGFDALDAFVTQTMIVTANNKSSMLQDVLRQQPTEIQFLNGYVSRTGRKHGISTPANNLLCERVEQLTKNFTTRR